MFRTSKHRRSEGFTFVKNQALDIKATYNDKDRTLETTPIIVDEESILNGSITTEV